MSTTTQFSVVLPVRNGFPYVKECVNSVLSQSYRDFELIVLDNASTDDTVAWVSSLPDHRIRVLRSDRSLTMDESWARIKEIPRQEFMTMIGHDDYFDPWFLETTKALIDGYPDASLFQTGARYIDAEGNLLRQCRPVAPRETAADYLEARLTYQRDVFGTGYVMRSADYDRVGGIPPFERLLFADDALFLALMKDSYKAASPRNSCAIRLHPRSESASVPGTWPAMLRAIGQFSRFLHDFMAEDRAAAQVFSRFGSPFMLRFHENLYLYALIGASQTGEAVDPGVRECIENCLEHIAPGTSRRFGQSAKVRLVQSMNRSLLRPLVDPLWKVYQPIKTRLAL